MTKIKITSTGRLFLRNGVLALIAAAGGGGTAPLPTPSGTVTVTNERQMRWIYQRVGTSKAVPVSGTSTAPPGTAIEMRAVDETSSAGINAWTQVATVGADGTWSGTLMTPQGKWYRRQVRLAGYDASIQTETNSYGVGIGILKYGQSNTYNELATFKLAPLGDPDAYECAADGVLRRIGNISTKLANGTDKRAPNSARFGTGGYDQDYVSSGSNGDAHVYFANLIAETTGLPVFVFNKAVIGQSIENLTAASPWTNMAATTASLGGDFEMVVFYQGENNIGDAGYAAKLTTLHNKIMALVGRDATTMKFGVVSLGPISTVSSWAAGSTSAWGAMRVVQIDWAHNTPGAFYVGGRHDLYTGTDGLHLNGESFHIAGRRDAKSVLAQLGFGTTAAGPRMVSASRAGSTVTVTFQHTGGTALQDGAGGTGTDLRGFQFKDGAGAVVAVSSTQITSATTVQLNLASTPTGACTLSYAMANAPLRSNEDDATIAVAPAYVLMDNATYFATANDPSRGCPAQPHVPLTVT